MNDTSTTTVEEEAEEVVNVQTPKQKTNKANKEEMVPVLKRRTKMSAFEEEFLEAFENTLKMPSSQDSSSPQDRFMTFFAGIISPLKHFNENSICELQVGLLKVQYIHTTPRLTFNNTIATHFRA